MSLDEFGTAPLFADPLAGSLPAASVAVQARVTGPVEFQDGLIRRSSQISRSANTTNERKNS